MKCIVCRVRIWEKNIRAKKYRGMHTVTNLGVFRSHKKTFAICKECWINPKHTRRVRKREEINLRRESKRKIYRLMTGTTEPTD